MKKPVAKFFVTACTVMLAVTFSLFGTVGFAADSVHRHTFSTEWSTGEKNHYHASTCEHNIVRDVQPHDFVNGKCSECGYVKPTVHTHTYNNAWENDSVNHWHAADCEHNVVRDMAKHTYENGKCTVCDRPAPAANHVHTFSSAWTYDKVNHWHAANCGDKMVTDMAAHKLDGKKCTVCGYKVPEPPHEHTYGDWVNTDPAGHYKTCTGENCTDAAGTKYYQGSHNTSGADGACSVCGYKAAPVPHTHVKGGWINTDPDQHYKLCTDPNCDNPAAKLDAEAHNTSGADGACSVCGYKAPNQPGESKIELTASGTYGEGIYVEWTADKSGTYSVYYQAKGANGWTEIDGELVRMIATDKSRADIVGLKAGTYSVKVVNGEKQAVKENLTVSAYDRSGYAHFNYTNGVGGYKDDGTPKDNALIIYVTESNKNTVTATFGNKTYTGIANILSNANKCETPIIVRIVGRVAAATWKKGNVTYTKTTSNTVDGKVTGNLLESAIVGKNGKKLPTDSESLTQAALIKGGYNELQTDISELIGLSSKATYKSGEYDSCWNNCSISEASNVTVEGIGTDAEIFQWGFTWARCNSIEVRNLIFDDYTEDACSFEGDNDKTSADSFEYKHFWLHHNVFNEGINYWDVCPEQDKHEGDGATDFKKISYLTSSYNVHYKNHKTGLVGGGDTQKTASISFHHNYYRECSSRLPLARQANMHMYNNYYYGSTGTNMSLRANAVALIEYCCFSNAKYPVSVPDSDKTGVGLLWQCTVTKGSQGTSTEFKAVANQVVQLGSRNTANGVTNTNNENSFGGLNFYLDSSLFYATTDSAIKNNAYFVPTAEIPEKIPKLAGVHQNISE